MDETMKPVDRRNDGTSSAIWWPETASITADRQMVTSVPEGEEEEEARSRDVQLYVVTAFLSLMSVVGTAGNALVLCVFFQKRKEMAVTTLLIIVLAVVDFVTCLVVIPYTVFMEWVDFRLDSDVACKVYQFLITSNIPFSALIMVLIAVDRYLCICHPFLRFLTVARAKGVIATLGLFAAALGLCVSLMYGVYERRPEAMFASVEQDGYPTRTFEPIILSGSWSADIPSEGSQGLISSTATTGNSKATIGKTQNGEAASNQSSVTHFNSPIQSDPSRLETESTSHRYYRVAIGTTIFPDNVSMIGFESAGGSSSLRRDHDEDGLVGQLVNAGHCESNDLLISVHFQYYYQKLYTAMYPVCLGIVIILYVLIYRSVLERRSRRQMEKNKTLTVVRSLNAVATTTRNNHRVESDKSCHRMEVPIGSNVEAPQDEAEIELIMQQQDSAATEGAKKRCHGNQENVRMSKAESTRLANLKTAAMLFVVTVVFVVTFLPAFLMALQLVPNILIVFYLYFANNVANPVIYSFMNPNFRNDLLKLFKNRR